MTFEGGITSISGFRLVPLWKIFGIYIKRKKEFALLISMASFSPFVLIASQNKSYMAVRLKDQDLRDSRQEAARAFIQNCLYGPGTNRTTGNFLTDSFSSFLTVN